MLELDSGIGSEMISKLPYKTEYSAWTNREYSVSATESQQIGTEVRGGSIAICRVFRDAVQNDRFQVCRNLRANTAGCLRDMVKDCRDQLFRVFFTMGRALQHKFVQGHSNGIDVAAMIACTQKSLGSHVSECSRTGMNSRSESAMADRR